MLKILPSGRTARKSKEPSEAAGKTSWIIWIEYIELESERIACSSPLFLPTDFPSFSFTFSVSLSTSLSFPVLFVFTECSQPINYLSTSYKNIVLIRFNRYLKCTYLASGKLSKCNSFSQLTVKTVPIFCPDSWTNLQLEYKLIDNFVYLRSTRSSHY